ncbi:MAG: Holliday junction resolvase RuvX [Dehalococcoidales bacterium]|nr:Holliday junction resolvase RuvX [Dehalococcoidales bacterium]
MARILGLDVGDKRIGLALSDPMGILASPLTIIERTREPDDIEAILKIAREREVGVIIVGLPRLMNGDIGPQAQKVQAFTEAMRSHTVIPIEFRDERLTTVTAVRLKEETGKKKKNRYLRYDAMAAAVILQEYLEENKSL